MDDRGTRPRAAGRSLLLALTLALAGCPGGERARTAPHLVLDPSGGFFDLPWPLDARRTDAGRPDLRGFPNPCDRWFIAAAAELAQTECAGFSPTGTIYFRFSGPVAAPIDDPLASVAPEAAVFLVDVDPASPERLRRHPIHVGLTQTADGFRPAHLLEVLPVPGCGLRARTRYACVVLRALDPRLAQAPALAALLADAAPAGDEALRAAYASLRAALPDLGVAADDVAAATVFTTGDPTEVLVRQVAHAASLPALAPAGPLEPRGATAELTILTGALDLPQHQTGRPPYALTGGRQEQDAQGLPVVTGVARAPFVVSVPKGPMPATGYPLYFYCHGTGGVEGEFVDRGRKDAPQAVPPLGSGPAREAALEGFGSACVAGPFSPSRLGLLAGRGYLAYDFLNPVAMRDNFVQMVLEQVRFLACVLALRIDPALCPGSDAQAAPDGRIRFDPAHVVVGGQSLGSYLAGLLAATHPGGFRGAVLTGAGGSWVEFGFGPSVPFRLLSLLEVLTLPIGERLDRFHPLIAAFDLALGPADNTHYHPFIVREPLPGHAPLHVLVVEGDRDLQVDTRLQRALVLAVGCDFVGTDPGPTEHDRLLPVLPWGGLAQREYPVGGNRQTAAGPRTAVVVRYREDGICEGHHVVFQLEAPKHQVRAFLRAIARDEVPVVARGDD